MSTYLVAYVVGEYDYVETQDSNGVSMKVYTPVGKKESGQFALDVSEAIEYSLFIFDFLFDNRSLPRFFPFMLIISILNTQSLKQIKLRFRTLPWGRGNVFLWLKQLFVFLYRAMENWGVSFFRFRQMIHDWTLFFNSYAVDYVPRNCASHWSKIVLHGYSATCCNRCCPWTRSSMVWKSSCKNSIYHD